ncbi:MAG: alpha/beta fold hydrolase [Phenylobacterium sp.]
MRVPGLKLLLLTALALGAPGIACAKALERSVAAIGATGALNGLMLQPSGVRNPPVVLIVPGSGPTDRDGNNQLGANAASYRLLAEALVDQGVASVRIDKRGLFTSAAPALDPDGVTIDDYAHDVEAWAQALKPVTGAACIWVLGHSEGALVAAAAAAERSRDICGLILVGGPGRPLGQLLREQLKANPANADIIEDALAIIGRLEQGQKVDVSGLPERLQMLFDPVSQGFLINAMTYDPPRLVERYPGPVLVVQGTTDLQVSMADAERLARARPGIKLVKVKGANHVLKDAPAERSANLATYNDPLKPVAHGVVDAIVDFVKARH